MRPAPNPIYNCHNPKRVKLITRLRLGLSHLREERFEHNFQDLINLSCNCGRNTESTTHHFLLHYSLFLNERSAFFSTFNSLDCNLLDNTDSSLTKALPFGNTSFKSNKNLKILIATIDYILLSIAKPCTLIHPASSTSTQLHLPHPTSNHLHPTHFSLSSALGNTLNATRS